MSKLPPVAEIASLLPEELAPLMIQDLASLSQTQRGQLNIGNYCNQLGADIHGPARTNNERVSTAQALAEAWSLLEHEGMIAPDATQMHYGWYFVTRRGIEAAKSVDAYKQKSRASHFPPTMLHAALRDAPYNAFVRGDYQQAISAAFLEVEVHVRDASGLTGNGVTLMRDAFNEETGPLKADSPDKAERQGLAHLFAGAFGWVRNPAMHRKVPVDDLTHAIEQLMLASLLLRIVDDRDWLSR
jgi:uncharacterized protein (TIGR02391 family)